MKIDLIYLIPIATVFVVYLFNAIYIIAIGLVNPFKEVSTRQLIKAFVIPVFSLADCQENLFK